MLEPDVMTPARHPDPTRLHTRQPHRPGRVGDDSPQRLCLQLLLAQLLLTTSPATAEEPR